MKKPTVRGLAFSDSLIVIAFNSDHSKIANSSIYSNIQLCFLEEYYVQRGGIYVG